MSKRTFVSPNHAQELAAALRRLHADRISPIILPPPAAITAREAYGLMPCACLKIEHVIERCHPAAGRDLSHLHHAELVPHELPFRQRRIAIVHDWLPVYGGAERVLEQMLAGKDADVFTLIDALDEKPRFPQRREG